MLQVDLTKRRSCGAVVAGAAILLTIGGATAGCSNMGAGPAVSDKDRKEFAMPRDPSHPPKEMFEFMAKHGGGGPPPAAAKPGSPPAAK